MRTPSLVPVVLCIVTAWLPRSEAGAAAPSPSAALAAAARNSGPGGAYHTIAATAQLTRDQDRTLAPYLMVDSGAQDGERLPLRETSADVRIAGVIAQVRVRQVFENAGTRPIEAIYVFPGSTRAAVHGMRMRIGQRTIEAKIDRRQAARETYQTARAEGRRASLLEQERPNVFTMHVANVMPHDRIEVALDYSELLVPDDGVYELVYPAVVGPRYGGGADPASDRWIANPYLREGQPAPYRFDVKVHLETGIALKQVSSPSHKLAVAYSSPASADIRIDEANGGDRDFVLRYRLAGDRIETGILAWQASAGGDGYFALMMEPPARPSEAQIPPREYIFLLDVSGSMHGFPLETAKTLMRSLLGQLRPTDSFNVALFSGDSYVMSGAGSVPATHENIRRGIALVDRQSGGGATELIGGLEACYRIPRREPATSRTVVVVTDGFVGVEARAFRLVRERLGEANLFAFGIGSSVNRGLIEGLARAGLGEPFVVLDAARAKPEAERFREYIEKPVLTNIGVSWKGLAASEVAPAKVPDLMARRPLVLIGKFQGAAAGSVEITGTTGGAPFKKVLHLAASPRTENAPLRVLWARRWVEILNDELQLTGAKPLEETITDLGLKNAMLTSFTSFVAVDSEIVNRSGGLESVRQPLPLPRGVSEQALAPVAAAPMLRRKAAAAISDDLLESGPAESMRPAPRRWNVAGKAAGTPSTPAPEPAPVPRWSVQPADSGSRGVSNLSGLVTMVARALERGGPPCAASGARLTVRLVFDAHGHVTGVQLVSGDQSLAACVRARLAKLHVGPNVRTQAGASCALVLQIR